MIAILSFIVSCAGFAALALSMGKHHRDLFRKAPSRRRELVLRITGWLLLALSIAPAFAGYGVTIGLTLWFGVLTVAAIIVALLLTYRETWWRG